MTSLSVSVVVPTYNRADRLGRLLDHLDRCAVPGGGFEVIVVDDGSTDHTREVVAANAGRPLYLRQANAGPATARNRGWRAAAGEFIAFIDDDCVPDPRWLTDLIDVAGREQDAAGVGGAIRPLVGGFMADFVQAERLVGHGRSDIGVRYLVTANALYRREVLEALGGFDEDFPAPGGEDTELSFRVREAGYRLVVTDRALVLHDHRTTVRGLLQTYQRHGEARPLLRRTHPNASIAGGVLSMLGPQYWVTRFRYYRRTSGRSSSGGYLALRAIGLAAYAAGSLRTSHRLRRSR